MAERTEREAVPLSEAKDLSALSVVSCGKSLAPQPAPAHTWPHIMEAASILVVDDHPSIRRVLERLLSDAGYAVTGASDGAEALATMTRASRPFGLVITDIRMPRMDGWELSRHLSHHWPDLPIVYLSAYDSELPRFATIQRERSAFFPKPFDSEILLESVARLLQ